MGLYNSIYFACPRCDARLEAQSKAGDTECSTFESNEVPVVIAKDIENETLHCEACDRDWVIAATAQINTIVMVLTTRGR